MALRMKSRCRRGRLHFSSGAPLPHAEHGFLGQRVAHLAGEHADLAAMVRVVGNQIAEESGHIGTESFYSAIAFQGRFQYRAQSCPALLERFRCLCWGHVRAIELVWNLASLGRGLQPHHAYVVRMSHYSGDGSSLAVWRLGTPSFRWQVLDHVLINAVVRVK